MQHLQLTHDDSILCITSAGCALSSTLDALVLTFIRSDNALHYAIAAQPRRIHAVDMNPCQGERAVFFRETAMLIFSATGHLLELKLAAVHALSYEDFWLVRRSLRNSRLSLTNPLSQLFGEGKHPNFRALLDTKLR